MMRLKASTNTPLTMEKVERVLSANLLEIDQDIPDDS